MVKSALNNNEAFVFVLMIDQRPEEIAEMENSLSGIRCEVVGSAFSHLSPFKFQKLFLKKQNGWLNTDRASLSF